MSLAKKHLFYAAFIVLAIMICVATLLPADARISSDMTRAEKAYLADVLGYFGFEGCIEKEEKKPESKRDYASCHDELMMFANRGGNALAKTKLGQHYLYGNYGFPKNSKKAVYWLEQAVHQGEFSGLASFYLGLMYARGNMGLPQDKNKARKLLQQAKETAKQGKAQFDCIDCDDVIKWSNEVLSTIRN